MPGISDFSECEMSNSKILCELKPIRSGSGGGSGGSGGGGGIIILDALVSSFHDESQIDLRGGDGGRGGFGSENTSESGGRGGNGAPGSQGDDGVLILSGPHRSGSNTNSRDVLRNKGMILYVVLMLVFECGIRVWCSSVRSSVVFECGVRVWCSRVWCTSARFFSIVSIVCTTLHTAVENLTRRYTDTTSQTNARIAGTPGHRKVPCALPTILVSDDTMFLPCMHFDMKSVDLVRY